MENLKKLIKPVLLVSILLSISIHSHANTLNIHQVKKILDEGMTIEENHLIAKSSLAKLKESEPDNPMVWTESARFELKCGLVGKHCERNGMQGRALSEVLVAQKIDPDYAEAWSLAGHIYTNTKQYEKASSSLDKAIELDPNHGWANVNYATLINNRAFGKGFHKDDDKDQVLKEKMVRTEKAFEHLKLVLDGDHPIRVKRVALTKCKTLHFSSPEMNIYCNLATIENKLYIQEIEKAWAYGNIASIYVGSLKDYKQAEEFALKALDIKPYIQARQTLASAYFGLWMDSDYKEHKYVDQSVEAYPRTIDIVNSMYVWNYKTELFSKLHKHMDINYSLTDLKGRTLLMQAFRFYMGDGDISYFEAMLRDLDVNPGMPVKIFQSGKKRLTTLPIYINKQILKTKGEEKEKYIQAGILIEKYSKP